MFSITSDQGKTGTCAVCGEPVSVLLGAIPPPPGKESGVCSSCGRHVCARHYSRSRKVCVTCQAGKDDWCKTQPPIP